MRHRGADVGMDASGDRAEDRRAEQHRFLARRCGESDTGGIREDLAHKITAPGAAADHDALSRGAGIGLCLEDLAQAVAQTAEPRDIERDQADEVTLRRS